MVCLHSCHFQEMFLVFVLSSMCGKGGEALTEIKAEFGRSVVFHCPLFKTEAHLLYYQKKDGGHTFMNGFHASHPVSPGRDGTQVNHSDGSMVMERLKIQDSGLYVCLVQYKKTDTEMPEIQISLTVTASYSKPNISMDCMDEICNVRCFSYGGYPDHSMTWNVSGDTSIVKQWLIIGSPDKLEDPDTKLFNISSTASVNCSNRAPRNISCSVGEVTSDELTVCALQNPPPQTHFAVLVILAVVAVIFGALLVFFLMKYRARTRNPPDREGGNPTELQTLNGVL